MFDLKDDTTNLSLDHQVKMSAVIDNKEKEDSHQADKNRISYNGILDVGQTKDELHSSNKTPQKYNFTSNEKPRTRGSLNNSDTK